MLSKDFKFRLDFLSLFLTGESEVESPSALKLRFFVFMLSVVFRPSRPFRRGFGNYIDTYIKLTFHPLFCF